MEGHVYILVNSALPNLVKIGRTTKNPRERAVELSGTGTPGKFIVAYSVFVNDCIFIEAEMHKYFATQRYSSDREFFEVYAPTAIDQLVSVAKNFLLEDFDEETEQDDQSFIKTPFDEIEVGDITATTSFVMYLAKSNKFLYRLGLSFGAINSKSDAILDRLSNYYREIDIQQTINLQIVRSDQFNIHGQINDFIENKKSSILNTLDTKKYFLNVLRTQDIAIDSHSIWDKKQLVSHIRYLELQYEKLKEEYKLIDKFTKNKFMIYEESKKRSLEAKNQALEEKKYLDLAKKFNV